jgi:integrase
MVCYGAGLRISEAVALKVSDIDSQRGLIRIEQGKGHKDRYAMLSPRLLEVLRRYYRATRPQGCYLFPSWRREHHLCTTSLQLACREAAVRAHIAKRVTVHTLRHYAGFRTMPGGASSDRRSTRQCWGSSIPARAVARHSLGHKFLRKASNSSPGR